MYIPNHNTTDDKIDDKDNNAINGLLARRRRCDILVAKPHCAEETLSIRRTGAVIATTLELFSGVAAEIWI